LRRADCLLRLLRETVDVHIHSPLQRLTGSNRSKGSKRSRRSLKPGTREL
jgi:hypothetical protein